MFTRRTISHADATWPQIIIGSLLLVHFVVICAVKTSQGYQADIFWMSHVALALAGAGFLLNSRLFVGAALTSVGIAHVLWLYDFVAAQFTHAHPLLLTQYLDGADTRTWIATLHHFYLLPLLLLSLPRFGKYKFDCFWLAVAITIVITVMSRALLPESRNVNWAFKIMPGSRLAILHWANALTAVPYLAVVLAWQLVINLLPAAILLRLVTARWSGELTTDNTEGTENEIRFVHG